MAGEWTERTIGDLGDVVGGSTPSTADPSNFDGDIPWLTPKDLSGPHDRYVHRGKRNLTARGLASCSAQLLPANTVLMSSRAPIGYLAIAANPIATNQGFRSLVLKKGYDPEFVYYWLSANIEDLERHASGSTFRELSGSAFKKIRLRLPSDLAEQRAIAHILGTLDDKIELNRRMSETLEAMVQALFRSWFVDFGPVRAKMGGRRPAGMGADMVALFPDGFEESPLGKVPKGWKAKRLDQVATFVKGVSYRSDELRDSDTALVTLKSVERGGGYREEGLKLYTGEYKPEQQLWPGDIVVAHTDLTQAAEVLGRPARVRAHHQFLTLVASLDLTIVRPSSELVSSEYLYNLLLQDEFQTHAYGYANGTTVLHLSHRALPEYLFILPPAEVVAKFTALARPLYLRLDHGELESRTLATLRDTLLPRLISGELRVRDAERFVGESLQ